MTCDENDQLIYGLKAIDTFTAELRTRVEELTDLATRTRALLAGMGVPVAAPVAVEPAVAPVVHAPRLVAAPVDPRAEEARQEQLRYLETRKAERAALVAQNRGA